MNACPGKYSRLERERRWLISTPPAGFDLNQPHTLIEDRYLSGTNLRVRQMADSATGNNVFKLSKKVPENPLDLSRIIITTIYLSAGEHGLLQTHPANLLIKRRYRLELPGGQLCSLDRFESPVAGLQTAEVEFASDDEMNAFVAPDWFGTEVTQNPRYTGAAIAAQPINPARAPA